MKKIQKEVLFGIVCVSHHFHQEKWNNKKKFLNLWKMIYHRGNKIFGKRFSILEIRMQ